MSESINAHTLDCVQTAATRMKEAITLLLSSNHDEVEPIVDVLRPLVRQTESLLR